MSLRVAHYVGYALAWGNVSGRPFRSLSSSFFFLFFWTHEKRLRNVPAKRDLRVLHLDDNGAVGDLPQHFHGEPRDEAQ